MNGPNQPPVQFDEQHMVPPSAVSSGPKTPLMARLVIKYSGGLVKNEQQAGYVLIGVVAMCLIISFFLLIQNSSIDNTIIPADPIEGV